jgi:hypothetical protein
MPESIVLPNKCNFQPFREAVQAASAVMNRCMHQYHLIQWEAAFFITKPNPGEKLNNNKNSKFRIIGVLSLW